MTAPILRTDDEIEAVYALDKALAELRLARSQPYNWKWVILALHNALQGFMVLALRFTNPALIARVPPALRPWEGELLAAYNQFRLVRDLSDDTREVYLGCLERQWRRTVPRTEAQAIVRDAADRPVSLAEIGYQLVDFSVLFRRIQSPRYAALVFRPTGQPFRPTPQQRADVGLLTSLRNEYTHFTPKSLVTHLEDIPLPRVVQSCLDVIDFLLGSGGIVWYRTDDEEDLGVKAAQLVDDMRAEARALAAEYGAPL